MPKRDDIRHVLVIGSGPIVIGQAAEFDYSGTQACRVLRAEGLRVVSVLRYRPGGTWGPGRPVGWTRSVPLSIRGRRSACTTLPPERVDGQPTKRLPASISPQPLRSLANRKRRVIQLWRPWRSSPNGRSTRSCDVLAI